VSDALLNLLGPEGFLFSYVDDVYMGGRPIRVALPLSAAPDLYITVGVTATYQYCTYRTPYILQLTESTGDYHNPYYNIEILVGLPSLW